MKRVEPATMTTSDLVAEHDRLVRDVSTYLDDIKHGRLEAVAEVIADRASYGDPEAMKYGIYL